MNGKQLKNSILQWAIQGKLVPQDPNDEPASVLLEKIRAEKARLIKEGKIKKDKKESIIYRGEDNSYYEKFADGKVVCIDDEIPFEIPSGWEWCRIREISQSYIGLTYSPSEVSSDGVIVLRSSNIQNGKISLNDIVRVKSSISEKLWVEENDIIICARNGSRKLVGKSAIIEEVSEPMTFGAFMTICKTFLYRYVHVFLQSDLFFSQLRNVSGTTTINQLTQNNFNGFLIPIPPKKEQERISNKLSDISLFVNKYGDLQCKLDSLNTRINEFLKKSILQEAILGKLIPQNPNDEPASVLLQRIKEEKQRLVKEGKLKKKDVVDSFIYKGDDNKYYEQIEGESVDITEDIPFDVPEGWVWCRLKSICSIFTGATFKKEDSRTDQKGIRILRGGNILPFKITFNADDIFLPSNFVKENILLQRNDIVTPAVTSLENVGKMARVKDNLVDVTVGGFVFILRPYYSSDWLSKYLLAAMSSPTIIEYMKSITNKSGQAFYNIGKERLGTTLLPIPPHCEQHRIVSQIEKIFSEIKGN